MRDDRPVILHARIVCGQGGGPEKTILNTPRFLDRMGYRTLCVYLHPPGDPGFVDLQQRAAAWGTELIGIPDRGRLGLSALRQLAALCRRERVAVYHGHDYKTNVLGLLLRAMVKVRLVTTAHGWGVIGSRVLPWYYKIDRQAMRWYETVVCVSPDLIESCVKAGVRRERCLLIENGIDTEEYRRRLTRAEARRELGMPEGGELVVGVGRLSPEKGFDLLVASAARLVERGRDVRLALVGEGPARPALEQQIAATAFPERFVLPGYRADVPVWLQAADLFALSSRREGLPNVLLEAMALETPVVAASIAGVPRVVEHDASGWLIPAEDQDALTGGLERLLGDAALRERYSRAARRTIDERYSLRRRMEKEAEVYDAMLGRAPVRPDDPRG